MKINITIPESSKTQDVTEFRINSSNRNVVAVIRKENRTVKQHVDISPIFAEATATQKIVIREFFKKIALQAVVDLNADLKTLPVLSDLEGDVFEEIARDKEIVDNLDGTETTFDSDQK